jgi:hypothetical protein
MRARIFLLTMVAILTVPLLAGCGVITGATIKVPPPTPVPIDVKQYNAVAGSAGQASALADFEVLEPAYIQEGFGRPEYYVANLGVGVPGRPEIQINTAVVFLVWKYRADSRVSISLQQSLHGATLDDAEPTELCGQPAERLLSKNTLHLTWESGGRYLQLSGKLGGPVTEDELIKVACSIIP